MKKILIIAAMAFSIGLVSCGTDKVANESSDIDSTSMVIDSVSLDTSTVVLDTVILDTVKVSADTTILSAVTTVDFNKLFPTTGSKF